MAKEYMPIRKSSDDEESVSNDFDKLESGQADSNLQSLRKSKLVTHILLLLTLVAFITNLYVLLHNWKIVNLQDGLHTDLIPSMPLKEVVFQEYEIYSSPPSPESNKAWDELLPPGRGYVFINGGQLHGLQEPGKMTTSGEIYSVALFHQIHCLGMLRGNYWELLNRSIVQDDLESLKTFAEKHKKNSHANHCFDYLRQSLQCAADMSLEWPAPGSKTKTVDGWGIPHLCKSWDSVMEYMDKNHFNASKRTDIAGE